VQNPPKPPVQNPPDQNPPDQKPGQKPTQFTYVPCPCANTADYWMDVQGQWHPYGVQVAFVGAWWMDATGAWHLFASN